MDKLKKYTGEILTLTDEGGLNNARYYKNIASIMKQLHANIPTDGISNSQSQAPIHIREEYFQGTNQQRAVIFLVSNGCEWALKNGHGCTICGHLAKQLRKNDPLPVDHFTRQFDSAYDKINFDEIPILNLYNNGSFFNPNEIPVEARIEILKKISNNPKIKMLVIETRPEFVNPHDIIETRQILPDKRVEVAIGLETMDDWKRSLCVNKGFALKQFDKAAKIITENGLHLRTYVLLKPPFYSEKEAIKEAVKTIKHAFSIEASTVSLESVTIQPYTLTDYLYKKNLYRLPWLWSIIEVVQQTYHLGKILIGLFQFYPSPSQVPHNCTACNDIVFNAMVNYDRTLDIDSFKGLTCDCKAKWFKMLSKPDKNVEMRIKEFIRTADQDGLIKES